MPEGTYSLGTFKYSEKYLVFVITGLQLLY